MSKGSSREGSALLQGIAYCQTCGLKIRPRYSARSCYYCCDREHRMRGAPVCGWASTSRVDGVVEETLLNALNACSIDLTFKVTQQRRIELDSDPSDASWKRKASLRSGRKPWTACPDSPGPNGRISWNAQRSQSRAGAIVLA